MSPRKSVSAQSSINNVRPASGSHVFARFDSGYISPVFLLTRSRTRTTHLARISNATDIDGDLRSPWSWCWNVGPPHC